MRTKMRQVAWLGIGLISGAGMMCAEAHYVDRYNPVAVFSLDQDPGAVGSAPSGAAIHKAESGLPKLEQGARDFTGRAWNFREVESSLKIKADGAFETLGDIETTRGLSVSFWMKIPLADQKSNHRLFGHPAVEATMMKAGYGGLNISFGPAYTVVLSRAAGYEAFDGQWHHVAATVDFSSRRNNVIIYLDGKEVGRADGAANKSFNSSGGQGLFYIGARRNGGSSFSGALDDVALFDYPLTPEQIQGILAGPVYAGADRKVYLPAAIQLKGAAPEGGRILWKKLSGPGQVMFSNAGRTNTKVRFSQPGEYVLGLHVQGHREVSRLNITVRPPSPPQLRAGDPVQIAGSADTANVRVGVEVPGRSDGDLDGVELRWSKLSGPGRVAFADESSPETAVRFSSDGLYQLQLTAGVGELTSRAVVSVQVGGPSSPHYALLLNPLYLVSLDTPANRESAGVMESAGGTCAELFRMESGLPQLVEGARAFTGTGWDFAGIPSAVKVHNRFTLARLCDPELTTGITHSLWFKGDFQQHGAKVGRIGGQSGVSIDCGKNTVSVCIDGVYVTANGVLDNQWHHLAVVADFRSSENNVRLYIDGVQRASTGHAFTTCFGSRRTDHTHYWGCRSNGGGYPFNGELDDIAVFDYPLDSSQVGYLYNGPSSQQLTQLQLPPPVIDAGKDRLETLPVRSVKLQGRALEGEGLSYRWEQLRGPGEVTFSSPDSPVTEVRFEEPGPELHNRDYRHYIFRLTASAGTGAFARSDRDEVAVVFHRPYAPKSRVFSENPPAGVHPRILFSPEDLPEMRERFKSDAAAQRAAEILRSELEKGLFNPQAQEGLVYSLLQAGKPDVDVKLVSKDNTRGYWQGRGNFYGSMATAAMLAVLEEDEAACTELAMVLSRAAAAYLKIYRPNYPNKLTHDADGGLALAYDLLHNSMDAEQRIPVRALLSKMTKWRQSFGSELTDDLHNSSNWKTHHDQIVLAALAIEGEEGYDAGLVEQAVYKLRSFLSQYGVFPSGYAHEGYTYYRMGMESAALSALALSRRGENLYETTSLYRSVQMMFRSMPPQACWVTGFGDASPEISGMAPLDWTIRYMWPDDPVAAYLIKPRLDRLVAGSCSSKEQNQALNLMALIFAVGPQQDYTQKEAAEAAAMPASIFCPDKGYMNARTGWEDSAVNLVFRSRMDKYALGHMHPDVNSFELYANGTTWFWDPGKYPIQNDFHQTILMDGRGGGGSSGAFAWPSLPGRFVEYRETEGMVIGTGDAKSFYDYVHGELRDSPDGEKLEPVSPGEHGLLWADFMYGKTRADAAGLPAWRMEPVRYNENLYRYNPVERAFRTAALVKGEHPFVLVVDDYQKDDATRLYEWIGNLEPGTVETVSQDGTDLILKKTGNDDLGNRLLVRVLQADGPVSGPKLRELKLGGIPGSRSGQPAAQVHFAARAVAPAFKVLLYPHREGDRLPETRWNEAHDTVSIQFPEQLDVVSFKPDETGRTTVSVFRNGREPGEL
ncbi:hypothetical protein PDESU_04809 [Pontiella desulfatans]|uniref:LamG-like jellyroll fold domain-containing protein n=1 Tax=Pontiella desulfatans TaxID=2750659 RepID=A0A6C2U7Z4_PONDE|nr:LamG domain-containing protein [Pontiella desulfatans]VGO16218.1 hypothetical protein PDESU_04809 [Pontiella desulfatans]